MAELTATDRRGEIGLAQAVATHAFGLALPDLARRSREADRARQLGMYLARVVLRLGLRETARGFGRNHRAVLQACRRIEEAREDPAFDRTVEWLETLVRRAAGVAA
ncbi:MAG TPA: helix-turn-helix domain-containing protein [Xanthobacteraceae bacterium]|jgi:chromosomal replication initiation ATPase DnaA